MMDRMRRFLPPDAQRDSPRQRVAGSVSHVCWAEQSEKSALRRRFLSSGSTMFQKSGSTSPLLTVTP
jgi:hypothetical protein